MEAVVQQLLTSAGFAGALLIVLGWAYWRKDRSEKAAQVALVKQAEKHGQDVKALQEAFIARLTEISDRRTTDAHRVSGELLGQATKHHEAMQEVAQTNARLRATLIEVRREIRHRNRKRSDPKLRLEEDEEG